MLTVTALHLAAALLPGTRAGAAEPIQIAGRFTCKTVEQHAIPVEGDPDHVLVVLKETCSGSASGRSARFDGGQQTMVEIDDLIKGSGMLRGYDLVTYRDGSTGADTYVGAQVTTMINGKPEWTAQGTWEQTRGTGSLANVQQRGTWTGKSTSQTEFVIDWEGTMTESGKQ